MMYEPTSICPYTERCENFQSIIRIGKELQNARWKMVWESSPSVSIGNDNYKIDVLQQQMENLMRAKKKCLHYHKRCLKFWQLKEKEEKEMKVLGKIDSEVVKMHTRP